MQAGVGVKACETLGYAKLRATCGLAGIVVTSSVASIAGAVGVGSGGRLGVDTGGRLVLGVLSGSMDWRLRYAEYIGSVDSGTGGSCSVAPGAFRF